MAPSSSRDLRHRVLTCVTKLSDKDTHRQAVAELNSIIPTLTTDTFSLFINSLSSTTTADRSAARSAALSLLASLSAAHGPSLSPHFPKLIAAVLRRLRDRDAAVRTTAAATTAAFAANITNLPFSSFLRPLSESLATEQESSAQFAAALCLAGAVDASTVPEIYQIVKMLPKWMKLLRCDGFKAKSGLIVLIRSSIRVCEIGNCNLLRDLVDGLMEFLKCEDWAARKAAAEALMEVATVERESLSELKASCLKTFESRKFDKVKGVREAMTQMVEAWKEIPDVFDDGSPPPQSQASSKASAKARLPMFGSPQTLPAMAGSTLGVENANDGCYPSRSKISSAIDSNTPQIRRKHVPHRRSSPSDSALKTTAGNRGAHFMDKRSSPVIFRNLESKKPSGRNVEATDRHGSSVTPVSENNPMRDDEGLLQRADDRALKPEPKRTLFNKNHGSRIAPHRKDGSESSAVISNASVDTCRQHKDCEDLPLIRKQLVQIENQQSSLMDMLQKFIGTSQEGMRVLETRVNGLEMALDDISYDLAVSTARMSSSERAAGTSCWLLPGSDFLSSKFWKRPEGHSGSTSSAAAMRKIAYKSPASNSYKLENKRFHLQRLQGAGTAAGVIVNPLAEIHRDSLGIAEASSSRALKNVHNVA